MRKDTTGAPIFSASARISGPASTAPPPTQIIGALAASTSLASAAILSGSGRGLARLPNGLQANCVADVTATYRLLDDGSLKVINRCREGERRFSIAVGRAVPASGDPSWARLKLSYQPKWLQWLPASSIDYWVVMLDPDYRYAVVSEPSRGSLWILSRTPTMDSAMYDGIVARLRAQRYPVDELVPTPQLQPLRHPPVVAARPRLMV